MWPKVENWKLRLDRERERERERDETGPNRSPINSTFPYAVVASLEQNIFEFSDGRMWEAFESPNRSGVPSDEDSIRSQQDSPLDCRLYWCDTGLLENLSIVLNRIRLTIIIHALLSTACTYCRLQQDKYSYGQTDRCRQRRVILNQQQVLLNRQTGEKRLAGCEQFLHQRLVTSKVRRIDSHSGPTLKTQRHTCGAALYGLVHANVGGKSMQITKIASLPAFDLNNVLDFFMFAARCQADTANGVRIDC